MDSHIKEWKEDIWSFDGGIIEVDEMQSDYTHSAEPQPESQPVQGGTPAPARVAMNK